jgi:acyl-CoA thioester hydrolase
LDFSSQKKLLDSNNVELDGGRNLRYHETPLQVRFYEVDSYGVVWHGHYVGWFETGRNDLTQRFQMGPLQLKETKFLAPVVELDCQFKLPATFGAPLIIQTTMERTEVAKLIFHYRVLDQESRKVLATGSTTHVLTDLKGNLLYRVPPEVLERIDAMQKYLEV